MENEIVTNPMPFKRKDLEISLGLGVEKGVPLHICSAVLWHPPPPGSISSCWVKVGEKVVLFHL